MLTRIFHWGVWYHFKSLCTICARRTCSLLLPICQVDLPIAKTVRTNMYPLLARYLFHIFTFFFVRSTSTSAFQFVFVCFCESWIVLVYAMCDEMLNFCTRRFRFSSRPSLSPSSTQWTDVSSEWAVCTGEWDMRDECTWLRRRAGDKMPHMLFNLFSLHPRAYASCVCVLCTYPIAYTERQTHDMFDDKHSKHFRAQRHRLLPLNWICYRSRSLLGFRVFCTASIDHECRMQSTSVCLSISSSSITAQRIHTHPIDIRATAAAHIKCLQPENRIKMCLRFAQSPQQDTHTTPLAAAAANNRCILQRRASREENSVLCCPTRRSLHLFGICITRLNEEKWRCKK